MATQAELAALSINAYTPSDQNRLEIPGWGPIGALSRQGDPSGFGASVFQGPGGEIVIAFRGTSNSLDSHVFGCSDDWTRRSLRTKRPVISREDLRSSVSSRRD